MPRTAEEWLPTLSVIVAIDTSGSMAAATYAAQDAAATSVGGPCAAASVRLLPFAEAATPATETTDDCGIAARAIDVPVACEDVALFDALATPMDLLAERRGRKAVVGLGDGVDGDGAGAPPSAATVDGVLAAAAQIEVPVVTLGPGTTWTRRFRQEPRRRWAPSA